MVDGPDDKWIPLELNFLICLVRLASSAFFASRFDTYGVSSPLFNLFGRGTCPGASWVPYDFEQWEGNAGINLLVFGRFVSGMCTCVFLFN